MRSGSLFTGAAGLDRAAMRVLNAELAWVADNDPASARLLAHHYPDAPNHGDITTIDWATVEPVELLTAGWPCQPWSHAGKRKGVDDERALWPEVARSLRTLRPRYVVLENVPAIVAAGELARAAADLAALGYEFAWTVLGANQVGAPHRRNRCFILAAHPDRVGSVRDGDARRRWPGSPDDSQFAADPDGTGLEGAEPAARPHVSPGRTPADSDSDGLAVIERVESSMGAQPDADGRGAVSWGVYEPAIRRWERIVGRPAPVPTITGARGGCKLNPALPEWMMGFPRGWIIGVPGVSVNEALKLAGNAVCEQQAVAALRWLLPHLDVVVAA